MAAFNPLHWRRTTIAGGLSEAAADETANLLHNVFSLLPTRQDVYDIVDTANAKLENRLIKFMVAISAINLTALAICTTLIITVR